MPFTWRKDFFCEWIAYLAIGLLMLWISSSAAFARELDLGVLEADHAQISAADVTSGKLDPKFQSDRSMRGKAGDWWVRVQLTDDALGNESTPDARMPSEPTPNGLLSNESRSNEPRALLVRKTRSTVLQAYLGGLEKPAELKQALLIPRLRGMQDAVFLLPDGFSGNRPVYLLVTADQGGIDQVRASTEPLATALASAASHARMIAITFGALMAMSIAALLIWLVLREKLLLLYALLFSLQAVYIAYLSGEGFDWPILSIAQSFEYYASKVPAGLSGAIAALFIREIAELRRFSPRVYAAFGWLAIAFVAITIANAAHVIGLGGLVAMLGNLLFVGAGLFTMVVAFLAWRRDNRAAGWFLIAWALLESFTIATALRLLVGNPEQATTLLYVGLPLSMVAAAVLVALGVADQLLDQRQALSEAERRAQTDSLTGALNRASFDDRLQAACMRAQARSLPIALLFIDLDHFKTINDTYGHPAGDACLKALIPAIQTELRHSDVIGRYGGEEFVVLLSSADLSAAEPIAERIRKRVSEISVEGFGQSIRLTCSIGVASSEQLNVWGAHLISSADQAVYAAKRAGRNRVQIATPLAA